jgi:hypothetical protein
VAGLFLPPVLGIVGAVRGRKGRQGPRDWQSVSPVWLGAVVTANWFVFAVYIFTDRPGGAGFNYYIDRFTGVFLILSLSVLILSIRASSFRWGLSVANGLMLIMWFSTAYAPEHWLERVDFVSVRVDERPIPATMYLGKPQQSEAEAFAVVRVPGVGDYFLNFSEETFRESSKHEFAVLPFGAWTWRTMSRGQFGAPLPFLNVNEYRIPLSGGRVLTVAF